MPIQFPNNIPNSVVNAARTAFAGQVPQTVAEAELKIQQANLAPADAAALRAHVADLPKLTTLTRAMSGQASDAGSAAAAEVFGGRGAGRLQTQFDAVSPQQVRGIATNVQQAFLDAVPNSKDAQQIADLWVKHKGSDVQAMKAWRDNPALLEIVKHGAGNSVDDGYIGYAERGIEQNLDLVPWRKFALQQGITKPLDDKWTAVLEASTFCLEAGDWGTSKQPDDQLNVGRDLLALNVAGLAREEQEKLAALVACSGSHMYEQATPGSSGYPPFAKALQAGGRPAYFSDDSKARSQIIVDLIKNPDDAKALIKARFAEAYTIYPMRGGQPHDAPTVQFDGKWLDDPKQLRQFADALFVLKMADRSRGGAYNIDAARLPSTHPYNTGWGKICADVLKTA